MGHRLIIAGTHSGVGKTTVTLGLIAALRRRGLSVQPFKCGPDYIDPTYHTRAAGRVCRNLDTWMVPAAYLSSLFLSNAADADVAVIEGVMGLFDGLGYDDETASTAQVAKLLQAPVILVLDVSKQARSAAALAMGFCRFDPGVDVAGFILNRVGSDRHGKGTARAVEQATGLPVLGWLPRTQSLQVPERHLGLIPTVEPGPWDDVIEAAADSVSAHVDIERLLKIAGQANRLKPGLQPNAGNLADANVVIAVARDEAFHFMYEENLELLSQAGASLAFFSPLRDHELPAGAQGLILSGGFPEMFAEQLAGNHNMQNAIRRAHHHGLPIYAECGGLMYLTESITDLNGRRHPMAGILPGRSVMTRKLTLGYRRARAENSSWLCAQGDEVHGHEFHYSTWEDRPDHLVPAYALVPVSGESNETRLEGAHVGNLHASYVHVHFWSYPAWGRRFVEACRLAGRIDGGALEKDLASVH